MTYLRPESELNPSFKVAGSWVLLTGATGLLGSALLADILARGYRVMCIVRADSPGEARVRLTTALEPWRCSAEHFLQTGHLAAIRGDLRRPQLGLNAALVKWIGGWVGSVVHAAGSTAFSTRSDADLARVNIEGTRDLFELAGMCGCRDWHFFSTAYVCGRCDRATETLSSIRPDFRNEYEYTKWSAEHEAQRLAHRHQATLTIYRPSVIVGHSESGVITRFSGIYRVFRATALLAGVAEQRAEINRLEIPLRIPAHIDSRPNLAFIDDVAREFTELFARPEAHGGIYHLTHPDPPTNGEIQSVLEEYYRIGGGNFIGANAVLPRNERNAYEDVFYDVVRDTEPYLLDSPDFERSRINRFVSRAPTPWTRERLRRQLIFAEQSAWRPPRPSQAAAPKDPSYDDYFQRFMPQMHRRFRLSRMTDLDLNVRYVIGTSGNADWFCRYRQGELVKVTPTNGETPDVVYRIAPAAFWRVVGGQDSAAEAFLSGAVKIEGDVERGLKFAVVLQEFVRDFPCSRLMVQ